MPLVAVVMPGLIGSTLYSRNSDRSVKYSPFHFKEIKSRTIK